MRQPLNIATSIIEAGRSRLAEDSPDLLMIVTAEKEACPIILFFYSHFDHLFPLFDSPFIIFCPVFCCLLLCRLLLPLTKLLQRRLSANFDL